MRGAVARLLGIYLFLLPGMSRAVDTVAGAREHYQKGKTAFDLGLYEEAIREYMEAYRLKDDPAILYNLGQAHRLAGHAAEALRFYRVYLTREPRAPNRAEVQAKIDDLQKLVESQKRMQTAPPTDNISSLTESRSVSATNTTTPPSADSNAVARGSDRSDPAPRASDMISTMTTTTNTATTTTAVTAVAPRAGRAKIVAGSVVLGLGVVLVATGGGVGAVAQQYSNELSALKVTGGMFDPDKAAAGATYGAVGPALIAIGGGALVAGVVVTVVGVRERSRAGRSLARSLHIDPSTIAVAF